MISEKFIEISKTYNKHVPCDATNIKLFYNCSAKTQFQLNKKIEKEKVLIRKFAESILSKEKIDLSNVKISIDERYIHYVYNEDYDDSKEAKEKALKPFSCDLFLSIDFLNFCNIKELFARLALSKKYEPTIPCFFINDKEKSLDKCNKEIFSEHVKEFEKHCNFLGIDPNCYSIASWKINIEDVDAGKVNNCLLSQSANNYTFSDNIIIVPLSLRMFFEKKV